MDAETLDTMIAQFSRERPVSQSTRDFFWWRMIDTLATGLHEPADSVPFELRLGPIVAASADGPATLWRTGTPAEVSTAAFNNAYLSHRSEFDDTVRESAIHASTVVLPALMAIAEARQYGIARLLESFAIGNEVLVRLSWGIGPTLNARGYHATGVLGGYGVVAGIARLLELDHATTMRAISLLCSLGAGIGQYRSGGGDTKALHSGWASKVGIEAVALAQQGLTGPVDSLEGKHGLFATHVGGDPRSYGAKDRFGEVPGDDWYTSRTQSKRFPVCHFLQPVIECAIRVRNEIADPREIERIDVFIPEDAVPTVAEPRLARLRPESCIPQLSAYLVSAIAIVDGKIGPDAFTSASLGRELVLRLSERTHYKLISLGSQRSDYPGGVVVKLRDGRSVQAHVDRPKSMDIRDIADKFVEACDSSGHSTAVLSMADGTASANEFIDVWLDRRTPSSAT